MSPVVEPTAPPPPRAPFVAAFAERRSLTMLALGFSAGLPVVLIFDTLSLWLRGAASLETIGFLSLVTLVYSFKFLWAPVVDLVALPLLTKRLGRRRSWMLASQVSDCARTVADVRDRSGRPPPRGGGARALRWYRFRHPGHRD